MRNIFLPIQKKRNFLHIFCRDCSVELMWKVSGKENKLYMNFIRSLKNNHLFKQKTMFVANIKPLLKMNAEFSIAELTKIRMIK